jgi:hypothetical protein
MIDRISYGATERLAFSCGARSAFMLKEKSYLRSMLSRRQLQGFVGRRLIHALHALRHPASVHSQWPKKASLPSSDNEADIMWRCSLPENFFV